MTVGRIPLEGWRKERERERETERKRTTVRTCGIETQVALFWGEYSEEGSTVALATGIHQLANIGSIHLPLSGQHRALEGVVGGSQRQRLEDLHEEKY